MKLIIEIDEEDYHRIASGFGQEEDALLLEKIFKNGTPIPDNATVCDIDAIKAEIDKQAWAIAISDTDRANGMWDAYRIIDKYKGDKE